MPHPNPYSRGFSFTDFQASSPSSPVPGYRVDAEFDHVGATLGGILTNLALIQRDDGKLADDCITPDALTAEAIQTIAAAAQPGPKGDPGAKGDPGDPGPTPNFTFSAHALAPGAAATVGVTGLFPDLHIDFGIPKGDPAPAGAATLADATYGDVVVSSGGTVFTVTKVGGQVPSFPGHTHTFAQVPGLQGALDAKLAAAVVGQPNGAASLDGAGFVPIGQIPGNVPRVGIDGGMEVGEYIDFHVPTADGQDFRVRAHAIANGLGWALSFDANALIVGGVAVALSGHGHAIADIAGLAAALAGKQPTGSYATTAQLAAKADAVTTIQDFSGDFTVVDGHNNLYLRHTGGVAHATTFNAGAAAGTALIIVNRATANLTIVCAGGYSKNGAATATANLTLAPGGKLTAFHEGAGFWTFDGTGF
jgi:hypothetical protein